MIRNSRYMYYKMYWIRLIFTSVNEYLLDRGLGLVAKGTDRLCELRLPKITHQRGWCPHKPLSLMTSADQGIQGLSYHTLLTLAHHSTNVKYLSLIVPINNIVEHAKFATWNCFENWLVVPGIFVTYNFHILSIYTFKGFCQFSLLENCLSSCEGLFKFKRSFINSRQKSISSLLWNVLTRGVINTVWSPLVILALNLYRTSLYFQPSLFIKKKLIS